MGRPLHARHELRGEPAVLRERFLGDPTGWLPDPRRWRGPHTWTVRLSFGPLGRVVACRVGPPWTVGGEHWRSLCWSPLPARDDVLPVDRGLPILSGELGFAEDEDGPVLLLHATYDPPGGAIGQMAAAGGLDLVARRTAAAFLEDLARDLAGDR